jgi:hypothetical protein
VTPPRPARCDRPTGGVVEAGDQAGEHLGEQPETARPGGLGTGGVQDAGPARVRTGLDRSFGDAVGDEAVEVETRRVDVQAGALRDLMHRERAVSLAQAGQNLGLAPPRGQPDGGVRERDFCHSGSLAHIILSHKRTRL